MLPFGVLLNVLEDIAYDISDQVDSPNYGGCGVIAALVGMYVLECGYKATAVVEDWSGNRRHNNLNAIAQELEGEEQNNITLHEWNDRGVYFSHVQLKIHSPDQDGLCAFFDSNGVIFHQPQNLYDGDMELDHLVTIALNSSEGWNKSFDRNQIPKIKGIIEKAFRPLNIRLDDTQQHAA